MPLKIINLCFYIYPLITFLNWAIQNYPDVIRDVVGSDSKTFYFPFFMCEQQTCDVGNTLQFSAFTILSSKYR